MIAVMATAITMSNIVTGIGWRAKKKDRAKRGESAAKFTRGPIALFFRIATRRETYAAARARGSCWSVPNNCDELPPPGRRSRLKIPDLGLQRWPGWVSPVSLWGHVGGIAADMRWCWRTLHWCAGLQVPPAEVLSAKSAERFSFQLER